MHWALVVGFLLTKVNQLRIVDQFTFPRRTRAACVRHFLSLKTMNQFELKLDAKLTRDMLSVVGAEYSFSERLKNKHFGIGHLRYISGNSTLDEFYNRHNHTIKTHFDWTKKGAVIRLRTISKIYAIGLGENGFNKIKLTKNPDKSATWPCHAGQRKRSRAIFTNETTIGFDVYCFCLAFDRHRAQHNRR